MKKRALLFLILFTSCSICFAQIDLKHIDFKLGRVRTFQPVNKKYNKYKFSTYPELSVTASLINNKVDLRSYLGYFDDHVSQNNPIFADSYTYRAKTTVIGFHLISIISQNTLSKYVSASFYGGVSFNFIHLIYIYGFGYGNSPGKDHSNQIDSWDVGFQIETTLDGPVNIILDFRKYFVIDVNDIFLGDEGYRNNILFGIKYQM